MALPYARLAFFFVAYFLSATIVRAQCGVERWPVKTATDADADRVSLAVVPATISQLRNVATVRPLPHDRRVAPVETTIYSVTATLVEFRRTEESDYQLVLADEEGRTIIARLPSPDCSQGSRFGPEIALVRSLFENRFVPTSAFRAAMVPIEVRGIGFFDFLRGQRGAAPNGLEIHPVTYLSFYPLIAPRSPFTSRKRAVGRGGEPSCAKPSLTLTPSKSAACSGELIRLEWQASDSRAVVSIDGVGAALPASGNTTVVSPASILYSGRATNACGTGAEAVAFVGTQSPSSASLSGPSSLQQGTAGTLSFSISGATSWTLSSSLRNSISPSSGNGSGFFTSRYTASSTGTDTVTLTTGGGMCGPATRTITIVVAAPANLGLQCCDGTRSPTCFSCSSKQGCCSGHRGVCGCP